MLVILTVQTDILSLESGKLNADSMGKLRMLHREQWPSG